MQITELGQLGEVHSCSNCNCIVVYKGSQCIFCETTLEMVKDALEAYGVGPEAIAQVDVEEGCDCGCDKDIRALPAVRLCGSLILGLPEEHLLHDALIRTLMMGCFREKSV